MSIKIIQVPVAVLQSHRHEKFKNADDRISNPDVDIKTFSKFLLGTQRIILQVSSIRGMRTTY